MNSTEESRTAKALARDIREEAAKSPGPLRYMEVCGTHTMAIHAAGLKSFFPDNLKLVSGPGCPVCVTEKRFIDHAILIGQKYRCLPGDFRRSDKGSGLFRVARDISFRRRRGPSGLFASGFHRNSLTTAQPPHCLPRSGI